MVELLAAKGFDGEVLVLGPRVSPMVAAIREFRVRNFAFRSRPRPQRNKANRRRGPSFRVPRAISQTMSPLC